MSKTAVIIQARLGSTRLPGKVLMDLCGQTVLERVIRRCQAITRADVVCCATTTETRDDPVAAEAERVGAVVFRGDEEDVLGRYLAAAEMLDADVVLRVTADCPLIDPHVCDGVLALQKETGADYVCNNAPPSWPLGLDCEAITVDLLRRSAKHAVDPFEREHVSLWARSREDVMAANFPNLGAPLDKHRWTIDYPEDMEYTRALFASLPQGDGFLNPEFVCAIENSDDVLKKLDHQRKLANFDDPRLVVAVKKLSTPLETPLLSKPPSIEPLSESPSFCTDRRLNKGGKPIVTLVRGPIVSTYNALNNEATPSIAFASISGFLMHQGYEVHIVDSIAEGLNEVWPIDAFPGYHCHGLVFSEVINAIPKDTDVIGISAMFSGEWPVLRELVFKIREAFPYVLIVAGGEHITALAEFSLRDCPAIDLCVRGEGELTFSNVLSCWQKAGDFSLVEGISYLDAKGNYQEIGLLPRVRDLSLIALPHWPEGYLEKFWYAGKSYGVQTERDMPIIASRGCPYRCTFCSNPSMWTTRYILRDVEDIIEEIKSYIARYDITALQFYDLTAITKKKWTLEFCRRMKEEGINLKWSLPSGTRSEALDAETLAALKETNCNYLVYAPESGSEETLKKIKKRIDLNTLTESVIEAKKQGIIVRTNLIIGFPNETRQQIFQTVRYGLYLALKGADEVSINIFSPYPGTEIFRKLIDEDKITINDDYFLALTSLNSDYTAFSPMTCNDSISSKELAIYRLAFMLMNYVLGYLLNPSRILRTVKNVFSNGKAETVLEHRLKDMFKRNKDTVKKS